MTRIDYECVSRRANSRIGHPPTFIGLFITLLFLTYFASAQPITKPADDKKPEKKEKGVYTVALLLPFHTNELPFDSLVLNLRNIPIKSSLAIHYYEGVLMALDSLDKLGLKLTLKVYDSKNDTTDIKKILNKPELQEADFIIGPVMNSALVVASRFAKDNKKYLISPLSVSSSVKNNPYFIMANASLRSHCEALTNYMVTRYKPNNVLMVYHTNAQENTNAGYFKNTFAKGKAPFKWTEITQQSDSNYFKIESHLSKDSNNIIVIPSFDEVFVNIITKQLAALSDNYKITVFGMPTWDEMESLRMDYLETIHTYVSSSYWVDDSSPAFLKFKKSYFNRFKSIPSGYSVEGYDLTYFIGSLLLKSKDKWPNELSKTSGHELGDQYEIKPVDNSDKDTDYMENKYVHILKYVNTSLVKVY